MNLGELINRLQQEDPNREIPIGFCNPHSHRGDYSELAFEVKLEVTIRSLLSSAQYAINQDFEGYKGGTYRMTLDTKCYLTSDVSISGIKIDEALLNRLLEECSSRIECTCSYCDPVKIENRISNIVQKTEEAGYVLAMRLLQSDLDLDDLEMGAIAQFTQPEVMRRVLRAMK